MVEATVNKKHEKKRKESSSGEILGRRQTGDTDKEAGEK